MDGNWGSPTHLTPYQCAPTDDTSPTEIDVQGGKCSLFCQLDCKCPLRTVREGKTKLEDLDVWSIKCWTDDPPPPPPPGPSKLRYGHCYTLSSPRLGRQPLGYASSLPYYRFGGTSRDIPMKVCYGKEDCDSHKDQEVKSYDSWYFYDTQGNSFSEGPALTGWWDAHLSPLSPVLVNAGYVAKLSGRYNCDDDECTICMQPLNWNNYVGFQLIDGYMNFDADHSHCVDIRYKEVSCPPQHPKPEHSQHILA
ncbi:hypothetical protein BJX96DRAFT_30396 [Aspergillus floccosus]